MRNPGGCLIITTAMGTREYDTFTCAHCNGIVIVRAAEPMPGGYCCLCNKPICERCEAIGTCTPFEKKLDMMEKRDRLRRSMGI